MTTEVCILKWNPAVSSIRMDDWETVMRLRPFGSLNWSVWEHDKVAQWQDFYMLKVGEGQTGIVMKGCFESLPYTAEDWSGKGRTTYYCDLRPRVMLHPDRDPILTTEELERAIPGVDWRGGHSGVVLSEADSTKLGRLWSKFISKHKDIEERENIILSTVIQKSAAKRIKGFSRYVKHFDWLKGDEVYTDDATHDCANLRFDLDYDKSEARLRIWLQGGRVLHVKCSGLRSVKTEADESIWQSELEIYEASPDCLCIKSNGVTVVCDEISFDRLTDHNAGWVPLGFGFRRS
ncbi:MAG: hypothetical protein J6M53_07255 [Bacteroidaceae bacterium]|nr:hypothetical protein [Bacteroidaceae bacterium]